MATSALRQLFDGGFHLYQKVFTAGWSSHNAACWHAAAAVSILSPCLPRASQQFGLPFESEFTDPVNRSRSVAEAIAEDHQSGALQLAVWLTIDIVHQDISVQLDVQAEQVQCGRG
jgi:hypothetical protein